MNGFVNFISLFWGGDGVEEEESQRKVQKSVRKLDAVCLQTFFFSCK